MMQPEDLDFSNLTKEQLKIYKIAFSSYNQGTIDTGTIIMESFKAVIEKSIEMYDKKIKEIDEILGKDN